MNRSTRMAVAHETVEIVKRGFYDLPDGRRVRTTPAVRACLETTRYFPPDELKAVRDDALTRPVGEPTVIEVHNETTLSGITRLLAADSGPVAALNFASAMNPGGGFLNGSQAQEESLARSSALYASLLQAPDYYAGHRRLSSCLYTDAMILSPDCPVFRADDGTLLAEPYLATFITSAAPNAGAIRDDEAVALPDVLRRRAEYVLAVAAAHGYDNLVLGAWGCGVFRNDPALVGATFAEHLFGLWAGRFRRVVFAVLDTSARQATFEAFREAFSRG
ncbi:MAG TPA: TIGR02452 family protein [Gemmataceae bacterium]|nr:TIGR02452 family protein [Gemmataceae bacterium]